MQQRGSVIMRVIDQAEEPIAGAFVYVEDSPAAFPEISLRTNNFGEVRVSLPVGTFKFGAKKAELSGEVLIVANECARTSTIG